MSALLQSLREEASSNMPSILVAADTSHVEMSWSKEEAPLNMERMVVTADVSHDEMSWSKEEAS